MVVTEVLLKQLSHYRCECCWT